MSSQSISRARARANRRAQHVIERFAQRYGLVVSRADIDELEQVLNSCMARRASADYEYAARWKVFWRGVDVHLVASDPSHRTGIRYVLTVLPSENAA